MPSFTTTLEHSIHAALALANSKSHEFATLEHLLLTLIDEPDAQHVLKACDVDLEILKEALANFIDEELSSMAKEDETLEATPTAAFQRVIQRAAIHVQSSGRTTIPRSSFIAPQHLPTHPGRRACFPQVRHGQQPWVPPRLCVLPEVTQRLS